MLDLEAIKRRYTPMPNGTLEVKAFVIAAKRDIPALVAEVERLRAEIQAIMAMKRRDDPIWDQLEELARKLMG